MLWLRYRHFYNEIVAGISNPNGEKNEILLTETFIPPWKHPTLIRFLFFFFLSSFSYGDNCACRLKTRFTKSFLRWTPDKTWWRSAWARWKRSWLFCKRLWKPYRKQSRATCPLWSTISRREAAAAGRSRHRRRTTAPSYNDDNNFYTPNRPMAASAVVVVVVVALIIRLVGEESRTRDPLPERGRPRLPREQQRPHQRPCPYLRNHLSHRRCHPSPNSVNSHLS